MALFFFWLLFFGGCHVTSSLSCLASILSGKKLWLKSCAKNKIQIKNQRKKNQMPHSFKFFIVEEVMLSSLTDFKWMNLNSKEKWESHFIPSHSKVLKKFQIPLKFQSLKQTNSQSNNYINIPKFIILWCYKLPHLKWISSSRFDEARNKG